MPAGRSGIFCRYDQAKTGPRRTRAIGPAVTRRACHLILRGSYDNWGKQRFPSGADDTANTLWSQNAEVRGFLGQEQVAQIGLINLNARMYDPWLGRFLQVDPIIGSIYNLQGLNPYSYVMNNPLTDSDPFGLCGFFACPFKAIGSFVDHAFAGPAGNVLKTVVVIAVVATFQYEVFPALAAEFGAVSTGAAVASGGAAAGAAVTGFADLAIGLQALDIGLAGAIGGALNTGTLRGALIGAATAEAFWGVGGLKGDIAGSLQGVSDAGTINVAAGVALHAAVGCASSAAGGGRCGSGALSAGLGELITSYTNTLNANPFVKGAIVGLGGGTGAAQTGGRFGDGFFIAASGYVFNECAHGPTACTAEEVGRGENDGATPWWGAEKASASIYLPFTKPFIALYNLISSAQGVNDGLTISFGQTDNQVYHGARHLIEGGYDVPPTQALIRRDIQQNVPSTSGGFTGSVNLNGTQINYSAYKFPNGTINVGRITPPRTPP
jgi:RHS repeat-associated protein